MTAAFIAAFGLSACETPSYGAGGAIGATRSLNARGLLASATDLDTIIATPVATGLLVAASAAIPAAAPPSIATHELKATALITGKLFLARGRMLTSPAFETPRSLVTQEIPAGWRLNNSRLVHSESGMECPLEFNFERSGAGGVLSLTDVSAYDQQNQDVSCNYTNGGAAVVTMYASFFPKISVEDHAAAAVAAMRQSFTLKSMLPVISVEIEDKDEGQSTADLEPPIAGAFDIGEVNGVPYKTAIWIAKTQGWHVKARATYAQADATTELVAAVIFAANYLNVDMKNKAKPTANGPDV
ncbi:MAG: hypothetical protein U5J99_04525 [Parvularculaceae bacterium]|nr:hypothetical protein [Parvularculaceae bacterium]